jgi:pyruvate dehydrogenase E2 component (dihydrolipoyllysine-residue acetyltransferase)
MATDVIMPALGVAQEKGTLLNWLKAEGQPVTKGEPLMEVETDKATVEIEAPASGILANVIASPGDEVPVGNRIAVILAPGEVANENQARVSVSNSQVKPVTQPNPPISPFVKGGSKGDFTTRILASPAAKRIAREKGIDLGTLHGSGPEGSILAEDVLRAVPDETSSHVELSEAKEVVPLSPMRRIVGQRMTQSKQTAPHFYVSMDIDMTAVSRLRAEWKDRGENSVPSINDFILHTCARALKDFPSLNSTYTEQGIMMHADINIGTAVALEEGLVVPVIRNADRLSLIELVRQSRELIDKAQKKKLFPLDYEGGTFTVSNLGMFGADSFIAIINPPQCAILAVGRVAPRVVAEGDAIAIRSLMTATLSADHRVVDGAVAARFLQEVRRLLERSDL